MEVKKAREFSRICEHQAINMCAVRNEYRNCHMPRCCGICYEVTYCSGVCTLLVKGIEERIVSNK